MSNIQEVLDDIKAHGITLEAVNNKLRCRPSGAVTPELVEAIKTHKPYLLTILNEAKAMLQRNPDFDWSWEQVVEGVLTR